MAEIPIKLKRLPSSCNNLMRNSNLYKRKVGKPKPKVLNIKALKYVDKQFTRCRHKTFLKLILRETSFFFNVECI